LLILIALQSVFFTIFFSLPKQINEYQIELTENSKSYDFYIKFPKIFSINQDKTLLNKKLNNYQRYNYPFHYITNVLLKEFNEQISDITFRHTRNFQDEVNGKFYKFIATFYEKELNENSKLKNKPWNSLAKPYLISTSDQQQLPHVKVEEEKTTYFININSQFAKHNQISIGSELDLTDIGASNSVEIFGKKKFKVTGFSASSDYLFPRHDDFQIIPSQNQEALI
jgi:hypothetical protein